MATSYFSRVNELERASSYLTYSGAFPSSPRRKVSQGVVGQLDSPFMHSPSRYPSLPEALAPHQGTFGSLFSSSDNSSPLSPARSPQCSSGQRLKMGPYLHRMVPRPGLIPRDLFLGRHSSSRLIRHEIQFSTLQLCVPVPRSLSTLYGRLLPRLGRLGLDIPFPSLSPPSEGGLLTQSVQRERVSNSPVLAISPLVRHAETQVPSQKTTPPRALPVSVHGPGSTPLPQDFCFEADRLEAIASALREKGWSTHSVEAAMAEHKNSTARQYQAIWRMFLAFLRARNIPHNSVQPQTAYNFLSHHCLVENKQYKTIACYKSALFHPLWFRLGVYIGRRGDLAQESTLMSGLHRLRPPEEVPMPLWLLSDLLAFLRSPLFEPLSLASDYHVFAKTLILLLLATGRRISEMAGLSRDFKETKRTTVLRWVPSFTPKHWTQDFHPLSPSFTPLVGAQDVLLCPRRAYKELCRRRDALINTSDDRRLWMCNIQGLTKMFIDIVRNSQIFNDADPNITIGPHQMRKLACSYNKKYFPEHEQKLFVKLGSKSMNVLTRTYIRSVPDLQFSCVLPTGTFIYLTPESPV